MEITIDDIVWIDPYALNYLRESYPNITEDEWFGEWTIDVFDSSDGSIFLIGDKGTTINVSEREITLEPFKREKMSKSDPTKPTQSLLKLLGNEIKGIFEKTPEEKRALTEDERNAVVDADLAADPRTKGAVSVGSFLKGLIGKK